MSTLRQKKLAHNIVENLSRDNPLNKEELVISSGYAVKTAEGHAPDIIDQKGVQEELKALGFDEDTAKNVVANILTNEKVAPKDRLRAASEVFKVHGSYAPEKQISLNVDLTATEKVQEAAKLLNDSYRT